MDTEGSELFTVTITLKVRNQAAAVDLLTDILRQIKSGAIKTEGFDLDCYANMEIEGNIAQWGTPLPEVDGES
jgi:hypothetical protein